MSDIYRINQSNTDSLIEDLATSHRVHHPLTDTARIYSSREHQRAELRRWLPPELYSVLGGPPTDHFLQWIWNGVDVDSRKLDDQESRLITILLLEGSLGTPRRAEALRRRLDNMERWWAALPTDIRNTVVSVLNAIENHGWIPIHEVDDESFASLLEWLDSYPPGVSQVLPLL